MNKVIVLGPDHYNTLGVVRSLGESGIHPDVLVYTDKDSFVLKSKYVEKKIIISSCDNEVISTIIEIYKEEKEKPILIGTSDLACLTIDENIDRLTGFICANVKHTSKGILKWMDKFKMNKRAREVGLEVPNCIFVGAGQELNILDVSLPCIIKPLESAFGNKSDIIICYTLEELCKAYSVFKKQKINVLVQDYIKADWEFGMMGCSFCDMREVYIPDIIYKKRFSNKSAVFAEVRPINKECTAVVEKIKQLILDIEYEGIFDVDFLFSNGKFYFIEVNLRNGAYGYGLTRAGVNFPALWVNRIMNNNYDVHNKVAITDIMCEFSDFKQRKNNGISTMRWIRDYFNSTHMVLQLKDWKPAVAYIKGKM